MQTTNDGLWPIDDCDAQDKERLRRFRQKRAEWREWLHGDDEHSIRNQILDMSENYLAYRVINESRRLAIERAEPSAALNPLVAMFIDNGYYAIQGLAVRRLTDDRGDVISLARLIKEIKANAHLFTREILVCFDGAPFDLEPARIRREEQEDLQREKHRAEHCVGVTRYANQPPASGPDAWEKARDRHLVVDKLSGKTGQERSRCDLISPNIFDRLSRTLESTAIKQMRTLSNKRIAHAADANSRQATKHKSVISFFRLDAAHRSLIMTAQSISVVLGAEPIAPAATAPFDLFEHLDSSWLTSGDKNELNECWANLVRQRERWAWSEAKACFEAES